MWSDNETIEDVLGFRVHADLIKEVVTDQKLLPVTMAVFGDWGSGKTSIMKMLQKDLSANEDIAVLYFDAWLFEGYDDAKSALISSILKQLTEHRKFPAVLKDQAGKLMARVNWMRLLKMGWNHVALPAALAYATGGASAVPSILGALKGLLPGQAEKKEGEEKEDEGEKHDDGILKDAPEAEVVEVRDFREGFRKLLEQTKFKALVVLIDDLDRCSPDRIVENLEAIKLFLNVENTAFVIGADPRIVRHAIAVRYKESLEAARSSVSPGENAFEAGEQLVRDYLEKLIQIPYHLPRLSPSEIETYMTFLFAQRHLDAADFQICLADCEKRRTANRFSSFGLADILASLKQKPVPEELKAALTFTAGAAHLITENLKGNPRQVKRFLNAFILRRKLGAVAKMESVRDDVLLKLMLLEYSNETRFRELARWHEEQKQTPKEIIEMENVKAPPQDWDKPALRKWAEMEPKLADIDLADYFWLARDRLASSLIGLSLTPPAVKAAYAALISEVGRKQAGTLLAGLRDDEIDALGALLVKHVQRTPKDGEAYHGFIKLVELKPAAMPSFEVLIKQLPAAELPGWLPVQLTLIGKNPQLKASADALNTFISTKPDTRAGKAAKTQIAKK